MRDPPPGFRFRLRAPRFGGLKPAVARAASEGGSLHPGYGSLFAFFPLHRHHPPVLDRERQLPVLERERLLAKQLAPPAA